MPEIFSVFRRVGQAAGAQHVQNHDHKASDFTHRYIGAHNVYYVKYYLMYTPVFVLLN